MTTAAIALFLASAGSLAFAIWRRPAVVFRPSMWLLAVYLVQICAAAAFVALPEGPPMKHEGLVRLLTVALPLPVFLWVALTPGLTDRAARLYEKTRTQVSLFRLTDVPEGRILVLALAGTAAVLLVVLRSVPIADLGLYAVFAEPDRADLAREETYKLLDSRMLQLALNVSADLLVPVAAVGVTLLQVRPLLAFFVKPALLLVLLLASSPNGARGPVAMLLVTLGIAYVLRRGMRRGAAMLAFCAFFGLSTAVLLTIARSGTLDTADAFRVREVSEAIAVRALVVPFETGVWTLAYVERVGEFGFSTLSFPLKNRLGFTYVPLPALVAGFHDPESMDTAWMNTAFLFDFQASFGLRAGWLVAVAAACGLDLLLLLFARLQGPLLVVFLAVFYRTVLEMASTSYSSVLFGALAVVLVTAWFVAYTNRGVFAAREA